MTRVRHRQSTCEKQCQTGEKTLASEATLDACEASSGHVRRALHLTLHWIKEAEIAKSIDELMTSRSIVWGEQISPTTICLMR